MKPDKVITKPTIRTVQNIKKKIATPKPTQKPTVPAIKEFRLQTLFEIGLRSSKYVFLQTAIFKISFHWLPDEFFNYYLQQSDYFLDEANKFIRSRSILGKPLEEQYEITRELDMNDIETKYAKDDGEAREIMKSWKMGKI